MKYSLNLLISILSFLNVKAQELPMKQVANHLINSNELSPQKESKNNYDMLRISKFFEKESEALFCFSSTSTHHYNFFLLRNKDSFLILNCENFIKEYEIMEKWFNGNTKDSLQYYIHPIIRAYQHNYNYHPTPPIAPALKGKNGEMIEAKYPPRKLIQSYPFIYPIIQNRD